MKSTKSYCMENKKILFASNNRGFVGGVETYIFNVAKFLKENGCKVYGLFAYDKGVESQKFLEVFEKVWSFDEINSINETFDIVTVHKINDYKNFRKLLSKYKITLFVHDHDYFCPKGYKYFIWKNRKNCTRPYCKTFCGICSSIVPPRQMDAGSLFKKNFQDSPRLFECFKSCSQYVVLSDFMRKELLMNKISDEKIKILHPFINHSNETASLHSNVILFAGQQVMSKGTPLFLESLKKIEIPFKAKIIGLGYRLDYFKKLSQDMGLSDRVEFLGWQNNLKNFILDSAVFAMPSMWQEPFGLAGCEAMALGVPVVAFDVGGISEWFGENCGILVEEKNTDAFAKALEKILTDQTLRTKLGENAKKNINSNFTKENFLENFFKLL